MIHDYSQLPGELIRGYLLTENTLVHDGDFSLDLLLSRVNDFSNIYGNLITRSLGVNIAGPVLSKQQDVEIQKVDIDQSARDRLNCLVDTVSQKYDQYAFSEGYELIMNELRYVSGIVEVIQRQMNGYFNDSHPWTIAKEVKSGNEHCLPSLAHIL